MTAARLITAITGFYGKNFLEDFRIRCLDKTLVIRRITGPSVRGCALDGFSCWEWPWEMTVPGVTWYVFHAAILTFCRRLAFTGWLFQAFRVLSPHPGLLSGTSGQTEHLKLIETRLVLFDTECVSSHVLFFREWCAFFKYKAFCVFLAIWRREYRAVVHNKHVTLNNILRLILLSCMSEYRCKKLRLCERYRMIISNIKNCFICRLILNVLWRNAVSEMNLTTDYTVIFFSVELRSMPTGAGTPDCELSSCAE